MTTAKTPKAPPGFQLPDVPDVPDEKMTASQHLSLTGGAHYLTMHLGNLESTVFGGDRYITLTADHTDMTGSVYPDLLVSFNSSPALYLAHNGYVISEQGKPPDFVLEVASRSTGRRDTVDKRVMYAQLGIPEYWRFDETGQYHGTRLAGDRLTGDSYAAIPIEELPDGSLRGYSAILNVELRWTDGRLGWHDPDTGEHIATLESERQALGEERAARIQERQARIQERQTRIQERQARIQERQARIQAESRVHELENQLRQLRGE